MLNELALNKVNENKIKLSKFNVTVYRKPINVSLASTYQHLCIQDLQYYRSRLELNPSTHYSLLKYNIFRHVLNELVLKKFIKTKLSYQSLMSPFIANL